MHTVKIEIYLAKVHVTIQSFILDMGPLLFISLLASSLLFFSWYYFFELPKQKQEKRIWLLQNASILKEYKTLKKHLYQLGQSTAVCRHCNSDKMQLWNHRKQELLVVRCRSCKMNYTLTKEHSESAGFILSNLDWATKLVNTLSFNRYSVLGKFLVKKLAIDITSLNSYNNPLAVFYFTTKERNGLSGNPVMEIVIHEWEEVSPSFGWELQLA